MTVRERIHAEKSYRQKRQRTIEKMDSHNISRVLIIGTMDSPDARLARRLGFDDIELCASPEQLLSKVALNGEAKMEHEKHAGMLALFNAQGEPITAHTSLHYEMGRGSIATITNPQTADMTMILV
jgi:hypothetical protein